MQQLHLCGQGFGLHHDSESVAAKFGPTRRRTHTIINQSILKSVQDLAQIYQTMYMSVLHHAYLPMHQPWGSHDDTLDGRLLSLGLQHNVVSLGRAQGRQE